MTVLATAGHVDHGKSTFVNFLTGQETDRLKEEKIRHFLKKNSDFEWQLSIYEELESTNDYLIEFANPNEYCLCVAESQKKGRGRNLKKWQSPKYENIYMSLSFSTNQELKNFSSFSLVSALAVHNVLLRQNIFTEIKWPNDIYLNKKKIGGILIAVSYTHLTLPTKRIV